MTGPSGGEMPQYTPGRDSVPVVLSPGELIDDPDWAEQLGLTVDASRLREQTEGNRP